MGKNRPLVPRSLVRIDAWATGVRAEPVAELETLAQSLNQICRTSTLDLALKVGKLVIQHLYGGDVGLWQRVGTASASYRALAARSELLLSPSALCRAVSVYALVTLLGGPENFRYLRASHFQEVLPLPPEERARLLALAEGERWTVAELRTRVRSQRARRSAARRAPWESVCKLGAELAQRLEVALEAKCLNAELHPRVAEDVQRRANLLLRELIALNESIRAMNCREREPAANSDERAQVSAANLIAQA